MTHGLLTVAACLAAFLADRRAAAAQPEPTESEQSIAHDADWKSASTVGAGVGLAGRYHGFDWPQTILVSAQFPIARFVVVEATGTQWSWHRDRRILMAAADEHWRTSSVGANVLLRAGREKLTGSLLPRQSVILLPSSSPEGPTFDSLVMPGDEPLNGEESG